MALASEMKTIMHDLDALGVKVDIILMAYIKALYPTYSNYLESLQASGNLKSLTFDLLVAKIVEHEKAFGKKLDSETLCIAQRWKNHSQDSPKEEGSSKGKSKKK